MHPGIVTKNTKITFRSRSSRIIWLVQISTEMWDYASPYKKNERSDANDIDEKEDGEGICEIYFDKFVRFMHKLFEKWKNLEVGLLSFLIDFLYYLSTIILI